MLIIVTSLLRSVHASMLSVPRPSPPSCRLNQTYQKLLGENEELQVEHKSMKSLLNASRLEQTRLETDLSKLREQHQQLDITSTKLTNQCEVHGHQGAPHCTMTIAVRF